MANYLPFRGNWQGSVRIQGGTAVSGFNPSVAIDACRSRAWPRSLALYEVSTAPLIVSSTDETSWLAFAARAVCVNYPSEFTWTSWWSIRT